MLSARVAVLALAAAIAFESRNVEAHSESKPKDDAREGGLKQGGGVSVEVEVTVADKDQNAPIPAMIRVLDEEGQPVSVSELLDRCVGLPKKARGLGWHVLPETKKVSLPAGKVTIQAVAGLEYTREEVQLDLSNQPVSECRVVLTRFWNAQKNGWVSGNTHLHLKDITREESDRYLKEVSAADGLRLVFVSYLERALVDRSYTTNAYSNEDLDSLSTPDATFGNGQEYRHNFGGGGEGFGHVLFLDQIQRILPSSLGPGIAQGGDDGTPLRPGIESAREQSSTVVWCHNGFGFEDIPSWLSGLVDAQNIFDGGNQGSYEDTFYRYLNLGIRVPFSTGTDWFIYDYSRVYTHLGGETLSTESWLEALRGGKTFITNGPLLEFSVDGENPGGSVSTSEPVGIKYRMLSREEVGMPELVVNGEAIELKGSPTREEAGWWEAQGELTLDLAEPCWVALRISPETEAVNEFQNRLFAHTSPVFVNADRGEIFVPKTAHEMIEEIQSNWREIEKEGVFSSETQKETVRTLYRKSIETLRERLKN